MKKSVVFLICLGIALASAVVGWCFHLALAAFNISQSIVPAVIMFFIVLTIANGVASHYIEGVAYLNYFRFSMWQTKMKLLLPTLAVLFAIATVLAAFLPDRAEMEAMASDEIRAELAADEDRSIKRVAINYQSLYFINYTSFATTSGTISQKYVGFAGHIYEADEGAMKLTGSMVNYIYQMLGCNRSVLYGVKLTLFLTVISVTSGLVISVFLALGKISKFKPISLVCSGYIFFFRGTPLLIQLFCVYLAIPGMINGFSWKGAASALFPGVGSEAVYWGAFIAAFIAFTLNSAAYTAEVVRASILSIDRGQHEAAKALGFTYWQTMSKIIIPQSISRLIPPLANEFIMVLKDASLVFAISLQDITTISKNISTSQASFTVFIPALLIFLVITAFFSFIFNKLEKNFSKYY